MSVSIFYILSLNIYTFVMSFGYINISCSWVSTTAVKVKEKKVKNFVIKRENNYKKNYEEV